MCSTLRKRTYKDCWWLALAICLILSGCTTTKAIRNDCRKTVETYKDVVECMIQLDNLQ